MNLDLNIYYQLQNFLFYLSMCFILNALDSDYNLHKFFFEYIYDNCYYLDWIPKKSFLLFMKSNKGIFLLNVIFLF